MPDKNNIGVITEQGYVAGNGLGFNPISENELNPDDKDEQKKEPNK